MILGFIRLVVGAFCATALFWAGIAWEHRPHAWPALTLQHVPFVGTWTWAMPDGPYARLAALQRQETLAAAEVKGLVITQAQINQVWATRLSQAQAANHIVTRTIIQRIPVYVTAETDAHFPLPWGLVRLHDAAARGLDPSAISLPAGQSDDAASVYKPSDLAAVIAENYGDRCRADAEQLIALQGWIRDQQAANAKAFAPSPAVNK